MHISTLIPVSLSLMAASVYAQSASQPVVSINVASAGSNAGAVGVATSADASAASSTSSSSAAAASPSANTAAGVIGDSNVPVWVVKVGSPDNQIVFAPNTIMAKPGEMVQFQFYSQNHSVATSTFDQPCVPEMGAPGAAAAAAAPSTNAFWSGFMPTQDQGSLTYTVPIKDNSPIWFYCSQAKHCQGGMVGVINPASSGAETLQAYTAKAATAPENISPSSGNAGAGNNAAGASGANGSGTSTGAVAQTTKGAGASRLRSTRGGWEMGLVAVVVAAVLV